MLNRRWGFWAGGLIIGLWVAFWAYWMLPQQGADPDWFFHQALSREMVAHLGVLKEIPQAVGVGWNHFFPDKEFLFHAVTGSVRGVATLFRAPASAAETAVSFVPFFLFGLLLFGFWWRGVRQSTLGAAVAAIALLCADPYFIHRMSMLRPHVLAVPLFMVMAASLLDGKTRRAVIYALLFALAYHAIYVPMVLLAGVFVCEQGWNKDRKVLKNIIWATSGIIVGVLVNPHFPGNWIMMVRHLKIAAGFAPPLNFGMELYPATTAIFLKQHAVLLCVFAVSWMWRSLFDSTATLEQVKKLRLLRFWSTAFWCLGLLSPRAAEYAVPLTALLCFEQLNSDFLKQSFLNPMRKKMSYSAVLATALVLTSLAMQFQMIRTENAGKHPVVPAGLAVIEKAAQQMPFNQQVDKPLVFSCIWQTGSYLYYHRPDLAFMDLLDPTFFYDFDQKGHELREQVSQHLAPDAYGIIKNRFGARYVFCEGNDLGLDADPRAKRLWPELKAERKSKDPSDYPLFVYDLGGGTENSTRDPFIHDWQVVLADSISEKATGSKSWQSAFAAFQKESPDLKKSDLTYLDLDKWLRISEGRRVGSADPHEGRARCAWVKPAVSSFSAGESLYLGIGGGPNVRVWLEDKPLYESVGEDAAPTVLSVLVPITQAELSRVSVMVCDSVQRAPQWGVALSVLSETEINSICRSRQSPHRLDRTDRKIWPYLGAVNMTCLAPIAARMQK